MSKFWSDQSAQDPKRAFRFQVSIQGGDGGNIPAYMVKKVSKPSFSISESTHQYLNHTYYYPGRTEWSTVSLTLVDPVDPDAAKTLVEIIKASGYSPAHGAGDLETMSKNKAASALGKFSIQQIDSEGTVVETWCLHNAWIKDAKFGELAYDSDDLTELEIEVRYDYASFKKGTENAIWAQSK
mgnify:CR=1 FL=1|jgi:hypothetical protein